jgi:hypothetical protein
MLRRALLAISLLCWAGAASGATVVDATGRGVDVPEQIARVSSPVPDGARALLSPEAARLPQVHEPPSINRLLGLAWLGGADPRTLAATFNALVYGRAPTAQQLDAMLAGAHSLQP